MVMSKLRTRKQTDPVEASKARVVTHDDIARRAYTIYVNRNREDGHDVEDWLQAERELEEQPNSQETKDAD
jgi:hypothetical protein